MYSLAQAFDCDANAIAFRLDKTKKPEIINGEKQNWDTSRKELQPLTHHVLGGESEAGSSSPWRTGARGSSVALLPAERMKWKACGVGGSCRSCAALRAHWPVKQSRWRRHAGEKGDRVSDRRRAFFR